MDATKTNHKTDIKWAPSKRSRWPAGCTATRAGWVRYYLGKTRFVCSRSIPLNEVEDKWIEVKQDIDKARNIVEIVVKHAIFDYRTAMDFFLESLKLRVGAAHKKIEQRTYQNYVAELNRFGNFICDGADLKIADMALNLIGEVELSEYAGSLRHWKASGFDSVVCRVGAFFDWCVGKKYITAWSPGPDFVRPAKQEIRDQRIDRTRSFTPKQVAKAFVAGNNTVKCWIALGICAAFINSDVAHVTRTVTDLKDGIIDFRRRKFGKVRRVIPLPPDVVDLLKAYVRPDPKDAGDEDLFFLSQYGLPFSRTIGCGPSCSISAIFGRLLDDHAIREKADGKNFAGLRTTFYNLAPRNTEYEVERKIIMGRAQGTIDLDSYLEDVGLDRLRHVVNHVWGQIKTEIDLLKNTST